MDKFIYGWLTGIATILIVPVFIEWITKGKIED